MERTILALKKVSFKLIALGGYSKNIDIFNYRTLKKMR
jgi:hypothetical protein